MLEVANMGTRDSFFVTSFFMSYPDHLRFERRACRPLLRRHLLLGLDPERPNSQGLRLLLRWRTPPHCRAVLQWRLRHQRPHFVEHYKPSVEESIEAFLRLLENIHSREKIAAYIEEGIQNSGM